MACRLPLAPNPCNLFHSMSKKVMPFNGHEELHVKCNVISSPTSSWTSPESPPPAKPHFQSLSDEEEDKNTAGVGKLEEHVKHLIDEKKDIRDQLELIDAIIQLGVAYHFENEIMSALATIYIEMGSKGFVFKDDLRATSLLFRLLRSYGFNVPQDVFNFFKDIKGKFKANLCHDIKGMLSLYEASYHDMENEETLEEAKDFTTKHLKEVINGGKIQEQNLKEQVAHALDLPLHWRMERLHSFWCIRNSYQREKRMNPLLLEFAKMDFNLVQNLYQREVTDLSRWWISLGLCEELFFARTCLVENYFWTVGLAFEPKYQRLREAFTKDVSFINVIDDIYDVYGSLDELELFTDVICRWDTNAMEQLPEYMKMCFLALFNTVNETAYEVLKDKGVNIIPHLQKSWADLCKSYLVEAKWHHNKHTPKLDEYLDNACISVGANVPLASAYCLSDDISKQALENFTFHQEIFHPSSMIIRLCDDLATRKSEIEGGDVSKSVHCYMQEKNTSEIEAQGHVRNLVSKAWKELNKNQFAKPIYESSFSKVALNIPRMSMCMYNFARDHNFLKCKIKDSLSSVLYELV